MINQSDKLGFTQKQVIELFVFSQLMQHEILYPQQVYNQMMASFPFKKRSRFYIYEVMKGMAEQKKLHVGQQGRNLLYSITELGKKEFLSFENKHLEKLKRVRLVIDDMLRDVKGQPREGNHYMNKEDSRFLSKVINVRELIRFLMLRELIQNEENHVYGASVFRTMKERYGWQNSDGYFYNILRKMENPHKYNEDGFPVIESYWADPDTRSLRMYRINDTGKEVFSILKDSLIDHLTSTRNSIAGIIHFFERGVV